LGGGYARTEEGNRLWYRICGTVGFMRNWGLEGIRFVAVVALHFVVSTWSKLEASDSADAYDQNQAELLNRCVILTTRFVNIHRHVLRNPFFNVNIDVTITA
jgi:hypothetical protein